MCIDLVLDLFQPRATPAVLSNVSLSPVAGNVGQWCQYTTGPYRNVPVPDGDHYFVSTHYQVHFAEPHHITGAITLLCQQRLPVSHVQYMLPVSRACQEWTQWHNVTFSYPAACLPFACAMWRQAPTHARPEVATVVFKSVL